MSAHELLNTLQQQGIRLQLQQGELRLQAPRGLLTPALQAQIKAHKAELLALLQAEALPGMDFSLFFFGVEDETPARASYELLLEAAQFADQNGFSGIWTPERHFHPLGGPFPNPAVLAAALAMCTRQLKLRAGSVVLPLQDPIRVAEEWAVVDNLSQGRVELSLATGWHANDFVLAPAHYSERKAVLRERLPQLQALWRGEALQRPDGQGQLIGVRSYPRPLQPELPLWLTAIGNPESFAETGRLGLNLLTCLLDQSLEELAAKIQIYRQARATAGHDPATGRVAVFLHTYLEADAESARSTARAPFCAYLSRTLHLLGNLSQSLGLGFNPATLSAEDQASLLDFAFERYAEGRALLGSPDSVWPLLLQLQAAGVQELACLVDFGLPAPQVLAGLQQLCALKQLSRAGGPAA